MFINIKQKFFKNRKKHIYTQIIKSQLILLIITIAIIYISAYYLSYFSIVHKNSKYLNENIHYINNQIDTFFQSIEEQYDFISTNQDIRSFLVYSNNFKNKNKIILDKSLQKKTNYFFDSNKKFDLNIFNLNQIIITDYEKKMNPKFNLKNQIWYKDFIKNNYKKQLYTNHISNYYADTEKIISYVFGLYNFTETSLTGFAKFDISYETLRAFLDEKIISSNSEIIIDNNNMLIYSSLKDSNLQKKVISLLSKESNTINEKTMKINNKHYLINKNVSKYTNWSVVSIVSIDNQLNIINNFWIILLPIISFIIIFNTLLSFNTSLKIVKPIKSLIESIKIAETGDFTEYKTSESNLIEIYNLSNSYSKMISEINNLVEKNHKINLLKIESELNALQQQINPHFLFNTLELISSQAILEGADATSIMTQKLGNLFRYNLKTTNIITIRKELTHINDYLFLQKIRFDDNLNVKYNIDETVLDYKIPKLTFQPLIENTIKHGFTEISSKNKINIKLWSDNENIIISIEDNGIGISPEKLKELNKSLALDTNNFEYFINRKEHLGLRNVNSRLCLLYNIKKALNIKSELNKGTTILINLPCKIIGRD